MARPRKSEPRDRQFNLSLTASEFESITRRAVAVGMRPVHFGRTLLLDSDRHISPKREADGSQNRLIFALSRLGNNLNQIMRHLHSTGEPLPADLEPLLNDIRRIIRRVSK